MVRMKFFSAHLLSVAELQFKFHFLWKNLLINPGKIQSTVPSIFFLLVNSCWPFLCLNFYFPNLENFAHVFTTGGHVGFKG